MNESEIIKAALKSAAAGVWDRLHGSGLSLPYARRVHAEITEALAAVERVEARIAELEASVLNSSGDNLCWINDVIAAGGLTKIPPQHEFLESCKRFHAQISGEAGELAGCKTIAQLEAEIVGLKSDQQRDMRKWSGRFKAVAIKLAEAEAIGPTSPKRTQSCGCSRIRHALEMQICSACQNRIGWNGPKGDLAERDWRGCPTCREAREALASPCECGQQQYERAQALQLALLEQICRADEAERKKRR